MPSHGAIAPALEHAGVEWTAGLPSTPERAADRSAAWPRSLPPRVLVQIAVSVVPAMGAVFAMRPTVGGLWFFGTLLAFLGANFFRGLQVTNLTLVVAVLPVAMLLRDTFFYNSVLVLLAGGVGSLLISSVRYAVTLHRAGFVLLLLVGTAYWLLSFMNTGQYSTNLRVLEMMLTAASVAMLAAHPRFLAAALAGTLFSLFVMGMSLLPFGARLGMISAEGMRFGNPQALGVPLALSLLLLVADRGRLFLLHRQPRIRMLLIACVAGFLLLSTSRTSWLIAAVGLATVGLFGFGNRRTVVAAAAAAVLATVVLLQTGKATALRDGFERTFSEERSIQSRTSGRSDQWRLFFELAEKEVPPWGYGPGRGPEVYAHYSALDPTIRLHSGREFMWHSLYLHLGVETGIVGLAVLFCVIAGMASSNLARWGRRGEVAPLVGTVGFVLVGMAAIGFDAATGLLMGIGLLSRVPGGSH